MAEMMVEKLADKKTVRRAECMIVQWVQMMVVLRVLK